MDSSSNSATGNPQGNIAPIEDYNASGMQRTVTDEALKVNQEQLIVEQTGAPETEPKQLISSGSSSMMWLIIIVIAFAFIAFSVVKIIRDLDKQEQEIVDEPLNEPAKKSPVKKVSKKTNKKKSAPNQRRKKTQRK